MPPPGLVIFDCDGVLVDSEAIANEVMAAHITACGWKLTGPESQKIFVGKRMSEVISLVEERTGTKLADDWLATFEADRDRVFVGRLKPVAGIEAVLDRLAQARIPFCVASSGSIAKMHHSLGITGLLPRLRDYLYSSTDVPRGKPFPDIFLHAAAAMGKTPPDCVVIEDTPTGAQAARAAGMRCFGYAPEGESAPLTAAGAACFSAMADLPKLLDLP